MMSAADKVDRACFWIRDHPRQFKTLMHLVHCELDTGREYVQRGEIYNLARARGMSVTDVRELRRDNNLWSSISRYMVMLTPRLARALRFRSSDIDEVDMVARWHEIVNPHTVFAADGWQMAAEVNEIEDEMEERRHGR